MVVREQASVDAAHRVWWALSRYSVAALLIVVLTAVAGRSIAASGVEPTPIYRAQALVVASDLTVRVDQLPKSARAIFSGGNVANNAVADGDLDIRPEILIPDFAFIEPIENTPVIRVFGLSEDPAQAANIANAAAVALEGELNQVGAGFGTFALQEAARAPTSPLPETGLTTPMVAGIIGGLALAGGLITFMMLLRQPVVSPEEVEGIAPEHDVMHVSLPLPLSQMVTSDAIGLDVVVRQLFPRDPGTLTRSGSVVFVGCESRRKYSSLIDLIVRRLENSNKDQPVMVLSSEQYIAEVGRRGGNLSPSLPTVVRGPSTGSEDIAQSIPAGSRTVMLVQEGVRQPQLISAVEQFPPGELEAVVVLTTAKRLPKHALDFLRVGPFKRSDSNDYASSSDTTGPWISSSGRYRSVSASEIADLSTEEAEGLVLDLLGDLQFIMGEKDPEEWARTAQMVLDHHSPPVNESQLSPEYAKLQASCHEALIGMADLKASGIQGVVQDIKELKERLGLETQYETNNL